MNFNFIKNKQGQGLLEMVVAIGVITTGLFGVWNLFISNYNGEQEAGARILAVNLAREGIEVVKNIRDSNWLHIENNKICSYSGSIFDPCQWDAGLVGDGSGIIENMFSQNVYINYDPNFLMDEASRLYVDPVSSFYSHDNAGQLTRYRRFIEIKNICCNDLDADLECDDLSVDFDVRSVGSSCLSSQIKVGLDVASSVSWMIEGKTRDLTIKDRIFNWK